MASIGFYGGAGGVTGANYVLDTGACKIMVDCGLFQGWRFAENENRKPFPYDPASIDVACITHAHADHIGRLPKLVKDGFHGVIYATEPTAALMRVMLEDAYKIIQHECEWHCDAPLYEKADLEATLKLITPIRYDQPQPLPSGCSLVFHDTAHILGSAMIEIQVNDRIIVFTGDLGNTPSPLLKTIHPLLNCDYLIMESVYGDRFHEPAQERVLKLERLIEDTVTRNGTLVIPTFALERTQELLALLNELIEHNRIPRIPVYLDSPLAISATEVYRQFTRYFNEETQRELEHDQDVFNFPGLIPTRTREESQKINGAPSPKMIIAGNPHGYGSRIIHHFQRVLPDPNSMVLFIGYARVSSLGRTLVDGAKEVTLLKQSVQVRARIEHISGYSAHADQGQLTAFVSRINKPIKQVFVTMGDPEAASTLATILQDTVGVHASVPTLGTVVKLE